MFVFTYFLVCNCFVVCSNTNVALEYLAKWWVAEQLLHVNTASEYCKSECRRAFSYSRTQCLYVMFCMVHSALFRNNGPTNIHLCVQKLQKYVKIWVTQLVLGLSVWKSVVFQSKLRSIIPVELQQPQMCLGWEVPHTPDFQICPFTVWKSSKPLGSMWWLLLSHFLIAFFFFFSVLWLQDRHLTLDQRNP